tara:strand:- start:3751 stop:4890 length:1140 start_codon:yes stop_codon:yes gene_type:complete
VSNFFNHIGIIGGGISGLTLGCTLRKYGINTVIFEKQPYNHKESAGISISPNGIVALDLLDLKNELKKNSFKSPKTILKYNDLTLLEMNTNVFTMNRRDLIDILYKKYINLGGEILFNYELKNIETEKREIFFTNKSSIIVKHIVGSDGVKSLIREKFFSHGTKPIYSGYSAWRGLLKSDNTNIEISFSPNKHLVSYPINESMTRSFTGVIKSKNFETESWRKKESIENFYNEFNKVDNGLFLKLEPINEIYKWGIYIRPSLKNITKQNITLIGDSAHPMVPFLGQGACLAIEDAYAFGYLCHKFECKFDNVQRIYQSLRLTRGNKIQKMSLVQGKLNHLKNPFLVFLRNQLMMNTNIVYRRLKKIHEYNIHNEVKKIL